MHPGILRKLHHLYHLEMGHDWGSNSPDSSMVPVFLGFPGEDPVWMATGVGEPIARNALPVLFSGCCRNGGIGRRTGLKIPRPLKACRFDPDFRHRTEPPLPIGSGGSVVPGIHHTRTSVERRLCSWATGKTRSQTSSAICSSSFVGTTITVVGE